ncbi:MAG: glycine cleavage system protein GcvH [Deltaproteobacteria bacterium]|nr:glycine cleavage system protein GcvH [Deltaproteobacteria bacterium]
MAEHLKFTEDHLWVRVNGKRARIGLSDYGQDELGEIIAVELPDEGDSLEKGESFGEVESVQTVSDLIAPVSGRVLATNSDLEDHPALVNDDPYHEGWLLDVELSDREEIDDLLDPEEYEEFSGGGEDE